MKKSLIISALLAGAVAFAGFAQDAGSEQGQKNYKYPFQESKVSYRSVQVYKVLDQKDAYIVMYAKGHRDVGQVSIPKKWYSTDGNKQTKLQFRPLSKGIQPYMSVFSRDGNFDHVVLTMPTSRQESAWGVAASGTQVDDADKDTLVVEY